MDADVHLVATHLPKTEAGRPERAPANSPLSVYEVIASAAENMTMATTASKAGQRNARDVWARHTKLTEEATPRETNRRAAPTEAGEMSIGKQSYKVLFLPPNA